MNYIIHKLCWFAIWFFGVVFIVTLVRSCFRKGPWNT